MEDCDILCDMMCKKDENENCNFCYIFLKIFIFITFIIGIGLFFGFFIVPFGACLPHRDYYAVYTNKTLPEGIVLNNVPCAFKFTGENIHCNLIYDNSNNRTIIQLNGFYPPNIMGILYVNNKNEYYKQLNNGFHFTEIHKESYRMCSPQSPTGI